jgi:hypothetical protein
MAGPGFAYLYLIWLLRGGNITIQRLPAQSFANEVRALESLFQPMWTASIEAEPSLLE